MPNLENPSSEQGRSLSEQAAYSFDKIYGIHGILMFFIGVLVAILQTKSSQVEPFQANYAKIFAFMVIIFVYVLTLMAEIILDTNQNPNWGAIVYNISIIFGTLASVLLMLVIVPPFGWFTFILWVLLFALITKRTIYQHYQFLCKEIPLVFKKIINLPPFKKTINVPENNNSSEQQMESVA